MKSQNIYKVYSVDTQFSNTLALNQKLKQSHNMNNLVKIDEQYKIRIENEIKSITNDLPNIGAK